MASEQTTLELRSDLPELPHDWQYKPLGDLVTEPGISYGIVQPGKETNEGVPIVRVNNIRNGRIDTSDVKRVEPEIAKQFARSRLKGGEVLLTLVGTLGEVAIVPRELDGWNVARAVGVIPANGEVNNRWIALCLRSSLVQHHIRMWSTTTVQATFNLRDVARLPIPVPPKPERDAIANILGVLDDKIELNRRMNETLEGLARAIFQSWFVDFDPVRAQRDGLPPPALSPATAALFPDSFEDSELGKIPKGWSTAVLDDVTGFLIGGDWGKESAVEDATEAVLCIRGADIPSLQSGGVGKMPTRYLTASSLAKRRLREGDIVFEISGGSPTQSTGRPVLATQAFLERLPLPLTCSNFCRLIRPAEGISSKYLYCLLRRLYHADEFLQYENGTTGIKNLAFTVFSSIHKFVLPPKKVMAAFEVMVAPIYSKMAQVGFESEKLAAIRDALLPKLLSGEIRVAEAERLVEEAG